MKVVVEPSFLLTLAVFFMGGDFFHTFIMLFSALIHESGHFFALGIYGVRIKTLVLGLFGGTLILEKKLVSYKKDAVIALSGSLFNFLAATLAFLFLRLNFSEHLFFFFLSNLFYAFFNLLPISTLDGGRVLLSLISIKKEPYEAEKLVGYISRIFLFLLACSGFYLVSEFSFNVSLFVLLLLLYAESSVGHIISGYEFCRKTS